MMLLVSQIYLTKKTLRQQPIFILISKVFMYSLAGQPPFQLCGGVEKESGELLTVVLHDLATQEASVT